MADIAWTWDADKSFDISLCCNDIPLTDSLQSAVLISLFSDARAPDDVELPAGEDRRGWWGDNYADIEGDADGSLLWLLRREKQTPQVLQRARTYARQALTWMLDDGVARQVDIEAEWQALGVLALGITITDARNRVQSYRVELSADGGCKCITPAPFIETVDGGGPNPSLVVGL